MNPPICRFLSAAALLIASNAGFAFELSPEVVNGVYTLAQPERSAAGMTDKLNLEYGEFQGSMVLVAASCPRCPPAGYRLLETETKELGRPVFFNSSGLYVFAYDGNTFVTAFPDGKLGKAVWQNLSYANVYSKQGTATISLEEGKQFVIAESARLMSGEGVAETETAEDNSVYYAAASQSLGSKSYEQINIDISPKEQLQLTGMNCRSCSSDTYVYQAELSDAIAKPVYEKGLMGHFMIEQNVGEFWWTNGKLGKKDWLDSNRFNVITVDKKYARKLLIDKQMQTDIDQQLESYAATAKKAVDARYAREELERTANNQLPEADMQDSELEASALKAAQKWANSYRWSEQLEYVYFTSADWEILRHRRTGIQTGRRINGVITMKRDDGLCSFQAAVFEQAFNGSGYQKTVMTGVVPGQNKLDCAKLER